MKTQQYDIFVGLKVTYECPSSVEEFDTLAKKEGACLESAIDNVVYRGNQAAARAAFIEKLEEVTNIARKSHQEADGTNDDGSAKTKTVIDETEGKYFRRAVAESKLDTKTLQELMDEVCAAPEIRVVNPAERERKTPVSAARYTKAAQALVSGGFAAKAAQKLGGLLGRTVEPTVESLALAIKDDIARQQAEQLASYAN